MDLFKITIGALGSILLLFVLVPIARMAASADPAVLVATVSDAQVAGSILLTLRAALWATLACMLFGVPLAYALARWRFPGSGLVQGLVDLPVMIPHTAAGIALLMVYGDRFFMGRAFSHFGIGFLGTEAGISLAMAFVSFPFLVNAAKDGFLAVDVRLERVARTLGASPVATFFKISLPLCRRSIITGAIMMWARGISEFGAVMVLAYHPMTAPVLIWERLGAYGLKYAVPVAVLLILLCLLVFALLRAVGGRERSS